MPLPIDIECQEDMAIPLWDGAARLTRISM